MHQAVLVEAFSLGRMEWWVSNLRAKPDDLPKQAGVELLPVPFSHF